MPTSYLPYVPDQQLLLPHSLQEWLPQGHLAHYINDTIDTLDLSAFFKRYQGGGSRNQPFHPAMMVKVLVYGYATGVFSSRKIAKKLHEDVAFRMLAADNFPKHRTLSDFRALHLQELAALFVQVVKLAGECGLVKLGTIAVDGTKLRAKASKHKAMSYERMQAREIELKAQIDTLLKRAGVPISGQWRFRRAFVSFRRSTSRGRRRNATPRALARRNRSWSAGCPWHSGTRDRSSDRATVQARSRHAPQGNRPPFPAPPCPATR